MFAFVCLSLAGLRSRNQAGGERLKINIWVGLCQDCVGSKSCLRVFVVPWGKGKNHKQKPQKTSGLSYLFVLLFGGFVAPQQKVAPLPGL